MSRQESVEYMKQGSHENLPLVLLLLPKLV